MNLFQRAAAEGLKHIQEWIPGGTVEGNQWVVKNPNRNDSKPGSFKINLDTGAFNDYADFDCIGHDAVTLFGYLNGLSNYDAANAILEKYDRNYFPDPKDYKLKDSWRQLQKSHRNAPELAPDLKLTYPIEAEEEARWPLEIPVQDGWRTVMWIVRFRGKDGQKTERPYTLYTNGKDFRWERKALKTMKYPLVNLRGLIENPNKKFILYEGQKVPGIVQEFIGDEDYICIGWYGGAGNIHLSDLDPLLAREGYFSFDADIPGRKAIKKIIDDYHIKAHLIYPPAGVVKGWDHADAIEDGWTKEDLIKLIETGKPSKDKNIKICKISAENRPTRLDIKPSQDHVEMIRCNLMVPNRKGDAQVLRPDWFFWLVDVDPNIRNCIKYDYTTGTKSTAYESSDLFDANLEYRLAMIGVPANSVTKVCKDRMKGEILRRNSSFNRVADYMDSLVEFFPDVDDTILDEFMKVFDFNIPVDIQNQDIEEYEAKKTKVRELYKELFHKYFIRMHAHINGTRKNEFGEYHGLLENDIVPILEGPQNIGKTTFCQWLACDEELYIDLGSGMKSEFGSADTVKKIRGRLIAELGEMKIMKSADAVETVKSFISKKVASVDIKFVENQRDLPMTASFMGTSNPDQYLTDDTGNRRFWPVKLTNLNKDFINRHREIPQRLHAYYSTLTREMKMNEVFSKCKPSVELEEYMEELRESALITYPDYEVCLKIIKNWKAANPSGGNIQQADVEKIAHADGYPTRIGQKSFKRAVIASGFTREREYDDSTKRNVLVWKWNAFEEKIPF